MKTFLRVATLVALASPLCFGQSATITDLADYPSGFGTGLVEGLIQASDGNFYFSPNNANYVFRVTPAGTLSSGKGQLDSSCGNGIEGGLVEGPDGNLYAAMASGSTGAHTFFKYSITTKTCTFITNFPDSTGTEFQGFTLGSDGKFYGMFRYGGANGYGFVFRIAADGTGYSDLYDFDAVSGGDDGETPVYKLLEGSDGNWYGVTNTGGTSGYGVVFQLVPGLTTPWQESQFLDFASQTGVTPVGGPFEFSDGNVYGAEANGGPINQGAIYETDLADNNPNPTYFGVTNDGAYPLSGGPVVGGDGKLYFVQDTGPGPVYGGFTVIDLNKKAETLLATFVSSSINSPLGPFVQGYDGNFYGIAQEGGANSTGGVWKGVVSPAVTAPITITASTTAPAAGKPVTLSWTIRNVNDKSAAQCYAYQNELESGLYVPTTAGGNWSGKIGGTPSGGTLTGSASVTATQSGTFTYAIECEGSYTGLSPAITVTGVAQASTSTTLTATPNPITYGSQLTLSATVKETSGSNTPTGSVTFSSFGQTIATVNLSSGVATLKANATGYSLGTYPVIATYNGDSANNKSTSNTVNVVLQNPTKTVLQISPTTVTRPGNVTITETVTETSGKGTVNAGSVTLYADGQKVYSGNVNSSGVLNITAPTGGYGPGTYSIKAVYSGTSTIGGSSSTTGSLTLK